MNSQERFHALMNFQPFDRLPIVEWATWWSKTIERWHGEGLPESAKSVAEIKDHFGIEQYRQEWMPLQNSHIERRPGHGKGFIDNAKDYEGIRERLFGVPVNREKWTQWQKSKEKGESVLWFTVEGFFWFPRMLFGIEQHLYAFFDEPELMHRICRELTEDILRIVDEICEVAQPDFMTFAEDMSYNHGPMLGKEMFDEFMAPYYKMVVPEIRKRGIISIVDTDGNIHDAAAWFHGLGVDGVLPLERQAGVDVARMRRDHPELRMIGAFDKMVMNKGEAAIRAEFERLMPTAALGGFIPSVDHQTPPGVSYEEYQLYLRLFREYAEVAGKLSRQRAIA